MSLDWILQQEKASIKKMGEQLGTLYMGCVLAKKVYIGKILRVMMVFKCLGVKCRNIGELLSNGTEKKCVYGREHKYDSICYEPKGWVCGCLFTILSIFLCIRSFFKSKM